MYFRTLTDAHANPVPRARPARILTAARQALAASTPAPRRLRTPAARATKRRPTPVPRRAPAPPQTPQGTGLIPELRETAPTPPEAQVGTGLFPELRHP